MRGLAFRPNGMHFQEGQEAKQPALIFWFEQFLSLIPSVARK